LFSKAARLPRCSDPVTFGGGNTMVKGLAPAEEEEEDFEGQTEVFQAFSTTELS
jgi:hypothetical protein